MVLTGIRAMALEELPTPCIAGDDEVLLRMARVGVCGSDVHYYLEGRIGEQIVRYPFPVGHECSAVVREVGDAVTRVKPGDLVAVDPAIACHACDQCRAGRAHTCRNLRFLGCPGQAPGCLSEFIVMPETCCYPVPDTVGLSQAALVEPLSVGIYAVSRSVPMTGTAIAILGAGPIGLSVLLAARAAGVGRVYVTDKISERLAAAKANGAHWAGNPDTDPIVEPIAQAEPRLLDAVFECCGEQEALDQAIRLLRPGGKLMVVGIPTVSRVSFDVDATRRNELCIQNVRRQNECVQPAIDLIAGGEIDAEFMVTHEFEFARARDAFELVADYRDGVIKAIITM